VLATTHNVISYQQLLLQKALPPANYQLASSLNFSLTKKRFTMMTKATPNRKALLLKLAALPVIAGLMFALCTETVAQAKQAERLPHKTQNNFKIGNNKARYYADVRVRVFNSDLLKLLDKKYEQLTEAEKDKYVIDAPEPLIAKSPTAVQLNDLKNKEKYSVWIDFDRVQNDEISKYKPEDFAVYIEKGSKHKLGSEHPQPIEFILITNATFEKEFKNRHEKYEYNTYTAIMLEDEKTGQLKATMVPDLITPKKFLEYRTKSKVPTDTIKNKTAANFLTTKERKSFDEIVEKSFKGTENNKELKTNSVYQQDKIYSAGEVALQPEFPGGTSEFYKLVNREFKSPKVKEDITARIYVSFVIETDGSMSNIKILRAPGNGMGEEAVRTLKSITTKWLPGKVEDKLVRTLYNLPIVVNIKS
jgi:hypothetical protein